MKQLFTVLVIMLLAMMTAGCNVSGTVTSGSTGLSHVKITVTNAETGNFYTSITTESNGNYRYPSQKGTYTITPSKDGYTFIPASRNIVVSYASIRNQNFTAQVAINSGSLDASFGTGGIVTTSIGSSQDYAYALGSQSDGKIVAAGCSYNGSNFDFAMVRYNLDGSLDTTFGTGGKVVTPVGSGDDRSFALGIQSDGKIVAAGVSFNGSNPDFALVRYNSNGSLDTTFGTGGKVTTPVGSYQDYAYALGIESDGKIVAAGCSSSDSHSCDFALVKYNTAGSLDTTFGIDGKVITPAGSSSLYTHTIHALSIQSDGKILAAGSSCNGGINYDYALLRYNSSGSLDTTFGTGGIVITDVRSAYARALGIQSDGRIVTAGVSYDGSYNNFALVRYNSDGSLDTTFGAGGEVITPVVESGDAFAETLGIQSDGKIVVAGASFNGSNTDFALVRYNLDGSLDTTFGTGGKVTTPIGSNTDYAYDIGIQSDGKILAAGYSWNGSAYVFTLVRYLP